MTKFGLGVIAVLILAVALVFVFHKPVAAKDVAIKPEVALEIRNLQYEQAKTILDMKTLESQYQQLQGRAQQRAGELNNKLGTALERSGLDPKKYEINPDTLAVTARVQVGSAPEKK